MPMATQRLCGFKEDPETRSHGVGPSGRVPVTIRPAESMVIAMLASTNPALSSPYTWTSPRCTPSYTRSSTWLPLRP